MSGHFYKWFPRASKKPFFSKNFSSKWQYTVQGTGKLILVYLCMSVCDFVSIGRESRASASVVRISDVALPVTNPLSKELWLRDSHSFVHRHFSPQTSHIWSTTHSRIQSWHSQRNRMRNGRQNRHFIKLLDALLKEIWEKRLHSDMNGRFEGAIA